MRFGLFGLLGKEAQFYSAGAGAASQCTSKPLLMQPWLSMQSFPHRIPPANAGLRLHTTPITLSEEYMTRSPKAT
jgi:hypothetical protein